MQLWKRPASAAEISCAKEQPSAPHWACSTEHCLASSNHWEQAAWRLLWVFSTSRVTGIFEIWTEFWTSPARFQSSRRNLPSLLSYGCYCIQIPDITKRNWKVHFILGNNAHAWRGLTVRPEQRQAVLSSEFLPTRFGSSLIWYFNPQQLKGINIKQCWLYPHCKVSLSITRS